MLQQALAKVSLFSDLQESDLDALANRTVIKTFPKNTVLINEGDRTDSLYLILSGSVKVYASDEEGKEILLNLIGPGEYFGELSLIDEEPRSASVMTIESAKMVIISRDDFMECLQNNFAIAISLLKVLTRKLRQQTDSTKSLALMGVYERVAKVLLELAEDKEDQLVVEGLSHKSLADRVFASREMISLILRELKQGGYIEADRKRIVIKRRLPSKW
jgi:CRP/FNR family cyclic AMP-dependent transcriptional regulator